MKEIEENWNEDYFYSDNIPCNMLIKIQDCSLVTKTNPEGIMICFKNPQTPRGMKSQFLKENKNGEECFRKSHEKYFSDRIKWCIFKGE